ncbi:MAG: helix-turn-helix transcriptional regulator [Lachnospiraceae bacterium]
MIDVTNIFSERLKKLRGKKTLQEVSDAIGITRVAMGYYEKGERKPDIEILYKIADFYKVSTDYLIGITDVKTSDIETKTIVNSIGLSESAINVLHTEMNIGHKRMIKALNLLICDMYYRAEGRQYRPFVELFANYLEFQDDNKKMYALNQRGNIKEALPQAIDDGVVFWDSRNLYITKKQKEELFLMEMENILKILKQEYNKDPNFLD